MPAWSRLRAVRAALFAAVCVTLAVSGHVFMSDGPVPWWAPAAALPVLSTIAWAAAGRERGLPSISGAVVGAQTVLHSLFGWAQQISDSAATAHHMASTGADHSGHHASSILPTHGGAGMLLAHIAAGLGSALWLWRGDKALFDLLRLLASRARCLKALLCAWLRWGEPVFPQVPFVRPRAACARSRWECRPLSRRGPPLTVLA
ncbi:hypothetical protein [Yinghuangia sp. YIM S09857]|uniref:hypothetical protein n=1 Tax=Yinghuangia sp. YIM S09857 TaxID=3436929 RepID=UPI003F5371F0